MRYQKCLKYITFLTLVPLIFVFEQTMGSSMDKDPATTLAVTSDTDGDDTVSLSDFDGDGTVGASDFLIFARVFGSSQGDGKYEALYDLDADGTIGLSDFIIFAQHFGKEVPPSVVSIPDPNLRLIIEGQLRKVRGSPIVKAEMENLTSLNFATVVVTNYGLTVDEHLLIRNSGGIKNLTGIEHATNLTHLELSVDLSMADLSPLARLSKLDSN